MSNDIERDAFEHIRQIAWQAVGTDIERLDKAMVKIHEYAKEQAARAQGDGEAVAWLCTERTGAFTSVTNDEDEMRQYQRRGRTIQPLYTRPASSGGVLEPSYTYKAEDRFDEDTDYLIYEAGTIYNVGVAYNEDAAKAFCQAQPTATGSGVEIISDIRHSADVDNYTTAQRKFLWSVAERLEREFATQPTGGEWCDLSTLTLDDMDERGDVWGIDDDGNIRLEKAEEIMNGWHFRIVGWKSTGLTRPQPPKSKEE